MASPLDGFMATQIAKGFKGKLKTAVLRREHSVETSVDAQGDPIPPIDPELFHAEGIRDNFTSSYMAFNQIPATDVRILLIMQLIQPTTTPLKDDQIYINNLWYKVRRVLELDAALAAITMQCFAIVAPTPASVAESIRWSSEFYIVS